ncbi:MAG: glycine cleavage system aminomethyltransferase GcvT [Ardenticatenia bacterium]|jgi:glycine hydroxymethyltransferase|nr:MAG: glycine cleavage system aminomethyltransferase GcvT [Ardenticatenia bacterium]
MDTSAYARRFLTAELDHIDADIAHLIALEAERQARQIILIPSESIAPPAVLQALGSVFNNVYAEGYPPTRMTQDNLDLLLEFDHQLAYYRRYGDRRFYKGTTYVHFVETLAQRRCAELFATPEVPAERIYVNVQPLSGAAANLAVYDAFLQPGDTLMGMNLFQGGHLSHGSPFHISGRRYRVVSYGVDPVSERLDYDAIMALALEHRPRMIVAGFTSYPWAPDWKRFREIADACGALLMADIAHPAGLASAGVYPNPVGLADVVVFTTHKTICGPRGAVIMTTDPEKARRVDTAVFPGAQGGPHPNKFAAMAVAFKIAATLEFKAMMRQIVTNAQALGQALQQRGLRLAYGGTDTHMLLVDLRPIKSAEGYPLLGEIVVRILELCGLVANKNTLPSDRVTAQARGVRLGTPWVTQRGMGIAEMELIADCIHRVVSAIHPFTYQGITGPLPRGKIALDVLESVKRDVAHLADAFPPYVSGPRNGYPHFFVMPETAATTSVSPKSSGQRRRSVLLIVGWRAHAFMQQVVTADLSDLPVGQPRRALLLEQDGRVLDDVFVSSLSPDQRGRARYLVAVHAAVAERVKAWLRGLSDGYLLFDPHDLFAKIEGPVTVADLATDEIEKLPDDVHAAANDLLTAIREQDAPLWRSGDACYGADLYRAGHHELFVLHKLYFIGQHSLPPAADDVRSEWHWQPPHEAPLKRTCLYEEHRQRTRHIAPFAGWEMPLWYTSAAEEHRATRMTAALYDVSHMGVLRVSGPHATAFLDAVTTNYVAWLEDGQSQYSYLLDPDGHVIDDIMLYRLRADDYLMVVNAANAEKDWDWLNAVNQRAVILDRDAPGKAIEAPAVLQDLKDAQWGEQQRVDIALQGPQSRAILVRLADDTSTRDGLEHLPRTALMQGRLSGLDVIIARTGYTGEEMGYELFVHPEHAPSLWRRILEVGADLGVQPAGLAARDSTRTEAGLPLYGHELAGPYDIDPFAAGFGAYVKLHKPFFVGRRAIMARMRGNPMGVIRFRMNEKGVPPPKMGYPVVSARGRMIGWVTSCAAGLDGFLVGMAYVEQRYAEVGARIGIFHPGQKGCTDLRSLRLGDEVALHYAATVLPRFRRAREE